MSFVRFLLRWENSEPHQLVAYIVVQTLQQATIEIILRANYITGLLYDFVCEIVFVQHEL